MARCRHAQAVASLLLQIGGTWAIALTSQSVSLRGQQLHAGIAPLAPAAYSNVTSFQRRQNHLVVLDLGRDDRVATPHKWDGTSVVLPIIASIDNFAVGAALGVGGHTLSFWTNLVIASANAAGMMLSGYVGKVVGSWAPYAASLIAAFFFAWIGLAELWSWWKEDEGIVSKLAHTAVTESAWVLAIPMTLNNLAAGVAGGLAGANLLLLGVMTLVASFIMMLVGHRLGYCMSRPLAVDPRILTGVAFLGVAAWQLIPYISKSSFL